MSRPVHARWCGQRGAATPVLDVQRLGGAAIVRVPRPPPASARALLVAVDELIDEGCAVLVVDLHDLEVLPPAGVAALRSATRAAAVGGMRLRIIADAPGVVEPLLSCVDADPLDVTDTSGAHPRPRGATAPLRTAPAAVAS